MSLWGGWWRRVVAESDGGERCVTTFLRMLGEGEEGGGRERERKKVKLTFIIYGSRIKQQWME